jgi:hypothetical protein
MNYPLLLLLLYIDSETSSVPSDTVDSANNQNTPPGNTSVPSLSESTPSEPGRKKRKKEVELFRFHI